MIDTLALPFDQYQRYRLVADVLDELRPKERRWKILDVGGRTELLRSFLPRDEVCLVDLETSDARGLVLGDGSALPFRDECFDVVAAFDTLEHVPPAAREKFVAECARVARSYVVLAGPYQSAEVEEAERMLQLFLGSKLHVEHRYLEEHRHNGLPSRTDVEAQLAHAGAAVTSIGHGNLERWLALICMSMYMDYTPELRGIAQRFFRFYNQNMHASDTRPPVYRHTVIAALAGAALPRPRRPDASTAAPAGATQRITELAFELVEFERQRAVWEENWQRLRHVNLDLERDLEGHRTTLAEVRKLRAEQYEVIASLERDLDGHRLLVEDMQAKLRGANSAQDVIRAEHQAVCAELEARLAEHRAVIATLTADLEGHRGALETQRADSIAKQSLLDAQLAEMERMRAVAVGLRTEIDGLRGELAGARSEIAAAADLLRQKDALITTLRSEVSNRWRSLKRALGPKRSPP